MSEGTRLVGLQSGYDRRTRSPTGGPGLKSPSGAQKKEVGAGGGKNVGELVYEKRTATYLPLTKLWFCVRDGVHWEIERLAQNFEGCLEKRNRIDVKNLDASLEERTSVQTESRDPRRPTFLSGFVTINMFCHKSTYFSMSAVTLLV